MSRTVVFSDRAPKPVSAYSQAIQSGSLLFLSGQIPIDPATGAVVSGTIGEEAERVMENLSSVLSAAGATLQNVLKTTVYLTNMSDFPAFNAVYARYFAHEPPARTTIAVLALPLGVRVEVEAIASLT
jgi:2-iminobutanoate/2-iminopropanoate deaminase